MQQVKYPNFENIQQIQPSQQDQDLQQQLINKKNENINFSPVLISPSENMQGQTQYQQYNEVAPYYLNQNHYVVPLQNPHSSDLLQDQEFSQQKLFLCGIIGLYIFWSVLFLVILLYYSIHFLLGDNKTNRNLIHFILLIIFLLTTILLIKLGIAKNYRKNKTSILIFFGVVLSYTCFYLAFLTIVASFSILIYELDFLIVFILLLASAFGNLYSQIILLIYLIFAQNKIKMIYPILFELFGIAIISIVNPGFLFCIILVLPYSFSLINAFNQIIKGRCQLKKNQLFAGAIASFYCQIVCDTD